jgi:hypothetical protein
MQGTRLEKATLVSMRASATHGGAVPQLPIYSIAAARSFVALANGGFAA